MHFKKPESSEIPDTLLRALNGSKIGVVIPCFNEEKNVLTVINTLPDYVDFAVVVDDLSTDKTVEIAEKAAAKNKKIKLLRLEENQGVGGAIAAGYVWCLENGVDAAVVMAGDGQMDPNDLHHLLSPVVLEGVNYSKGNRLLHPDARRSIPKIRLFGNSVLSLLTKFASGYWHIADSQCGYTVIDRAALSTIDWHKMYKRYGQPNDLLITLNIHNFSVRDITIRPVYDVGEVSGIKINKVILPILGILFRGGLKRIGLKYILFDFHPLVLFLMLAVFMGLLSLMFFIHVLVCFTVGLQTPLISLISFLFTLSFALNSFFFATWMDMEANKNLR